MPTRDSVKLDHVLLKVFPTLNLPVGLFLLQDDAWSCSITWHNLLNWYYLSFLATFSLLFVKVNLTNRKVNISQMHIAWWIFTTWTSPDENIISTLEAPPLYSLPVIISTTPRASPTPRVITILFSNCIETSCSVAKLRSYVLYIHGLILICICLRSTLCSEDSFILLHGQHSFLCCVVFHCETISEFTFILFLLAFG